MKKNIGEKGIVSKKEEKREIKNVERESIGEERGNDENLKVDEKKGKKKRKKEKKDKR